MNPLPARSLQDRDGRKVEKPKRAGGPERGPSDLAASQDLETQAGRDVKPPNA